MAKPADTEPASEWVEDDPEMESSMEMEDEELEFDNFEDEETGVEVAGKPASQRDYVPLWRLIEMSREDRSLRLELADFEDYEDFDGVDGEYAGGLSH